MIIKVEKADWLTHEKELSTVRINVFVKEQQIPLELEIEAEDALAHHVLATIDNQPVGTGRILANGKIGRMAVIKEYRHLGIGTKILNKLVAIAKENQMPAAFLNAQVSVLAFYESCGFIINGLPFDEVGIQHICMKKKI